MSSRKTGDESLQTRKPMILAPAGDSRSFFAAVAAGADAVYCGLKSFSARMQAKNFSITELAMLADVARKNGTRLYLAFNSLIKTCELKEAGKLLNEAIRMIEPDALIFQDLSVAELARQAGFSGELHLSTLANASFPLGFISASDGLGVSRIVLPRELDIDEIKRCAAVCPQDMGLEVFVHGALCYGVSGRCYWSSLLGGKSGLRGRCVQPCRRRYSQNKQNRKYFSCMDLSLDVLVKVLSRIDKVVAWKIEGRKKGPHYVYHTVMAYRALRDFGKDPSLKKQAVKSLEMALGRSGTHYRFLSHRPQDPLSGKDKTDSGLMVGLLKGPITKAYLQPRIDLLKGDRLRVGNEEERFHRVITLKSSVPKGGRYYIQGRSPKNAPVFLIDRREPELDEKIRSLEKELIERKKEAFFSFSLKIPKGRAADQAGTYTKIFLCSDITEAKNTKSGAVWLDEKSVAMIAKKDARRLWWWLPPVIWPEDEERVVKLVSACMKKGGRFFVVNAPWQTAIFERKPEKIWAGPFCNIANPLAVDAVKRMKADGVIVSPELSMKDYILLAQKSPLPLGIVMRGLWPLTISRIADRDMKKGTILRSPKKEGLYAVKRDGNWWVYPDWELDFRRERKTFIKAGYTLFVEIREKVPPGISLLKRSGFWNLYAELL